MVTSLVAPLGLFWFGRGPLGRQARRRRVRVIAISAFLVPLMAIGPESVLALHDEAALYQAVAAAAVGQTDPTAITYTYDANGNLTKRTAGSATDTYVYDRQNRLVSADLQIGGVRSLSFGYDADGIRNRRTVNGQTTFHLVDPNQPYAQVLAEHNGEGDVSVRYAYGLDLLTQTRGTNTWYYHYDGQLSTRLLTDSAGLPVTGHNAYAYDAFGNLLSGNPDSNNSYRYTGEQLDPDLGFYYLRARYYVQDIGRFTARDPVSGLISDPITLHKYLYVGADPMNMADPSGEQAVAVSMIMNISALLGQVCMRLCSALPALTAIACKVFALYTVAMMASLAYRWVYAGGDVMAASAVLAMTAFQEYFRKAIRDIARRLGRTIQQLMRLKPYPVSKRLTPQIYAFDVAALAANPTWFVLTYNGPGSPRTLTNRAWVKGMYGFMMATAPVYYQLDEFPYASTARGGLAGPAWGMPVPLWENSMIQGPSLSIFYMTQLRRAKPFLVVPVPV